jgi:hypothetical protein
VGLSRRPLDAAYDWLGLGPPPDTTITSQVTFEGSGPIAAVYGFESPLSSGRSVVAVTAVVPDQLLRVVDALESSTQRKAIRGSAAFVLPGKVESVLVGRTYSHGFLPPWTGATYWIAAHPWLTAIFASMALAPIVALGWLLRRRLAARRDRRNP